MKLCSVATMIPIVVFFLSTTSSTVLASPAPKHHHKSHHGHSHEEHKNHEGHRAHEKHHSHDKHHSHNHETHQLSRRAVGFDCRNYSGSEWVWLDEMSDYIYAACNHMVGSEAKHLGAEDTLEYKGSLDGDDMTTVLYVRGGPMLITNAMCMDNLEAIDEECTDKGWLYDSFYGGSRTIEHEGASLRLRMDPVG